MTLELSLTRLDGPNPYDLSGSPAVWGKGYQAFWMPNGFLLSLFETDPDFYNDSVRFTGSTVGLNDQGVVKTRKAITSALRHLQTEKGVPPECLSFRDCSWHVPRSNGEVMRGQFQDTFARAQTLAKNSAMPLQGFKDHLLAIGVPEARLEAALDLFERTDARSIDDCITSTHSGAVIPFRMDTVYGEIDAFAKISPHQRNLRAARGYLLDAWQKPLLRPSTTKLLSYTKAESVDVMVTAASWEQAKLCPQEIRQVEFLKRRVLTMYAQNNNLNPTQVIKNKTANVVFTIALHHTLMHDKHEKDLYTPSRELILPYDRLIQRAQTDRFDNAQELLKKIQARYQDAKRRLGDLPLAVLPHSVLHNDLLSKNQFKGPNGTVLGDWDFVASRPIEYEFARLGTNAARIYLGVQEALQEELPRYHDIAIIPPLRVKRNVCLEKVGLLEQLSAARTLSAYVSLADCDQVRTYSSKVASLFGI